MTLREGSTRTGFQVLLETNCRTFARKLVTTTEPRAMIDGQSGWAVIVPFETITNVIRDPNIVKGWVGGTLNDVYDSLFDSVHTSLDARIVPARNLSLLSSGHADPCRVIVTRRTCLGSRA